MVTVYIGGSALTEHDFLPVLTATELSTLSTHGHQATQVIAGSFSFSSQGPLRARWLFLLVQEGLGYPASQQTETLGGWRGPGSAVGSLKQDGDCTPSCPAEWWGSGETAPPKFLLDMQESAFCSVTLHGEESQQVLCLPALSYFTSQHLAASLALPGKGHKHPQACAVFVAFPHPPLHNSGGWRGCGTCCWGPASASALLASAPTPLPSWPGRCFLVLRASKLLSLHALDSSRSSEALVSRNQA